MIGTYYPIALTLPDGGERVHVATVIGIDHARAPELLDLVRSIVLAAGRSHVEAAQIRTSLDGDDQIAAPAEIHHLAAAAAAQIVAWLADGADAAA